MPSNLSLMLKPIYSVQIRLAELQLNSIVILYPAIAIELYISLNSVNEMLQLAAKSSDMLLDAIAGLVQLSHYQVAQSINQLLLNAKDESHRGQLLLKEYPLELIENLRQLQAELEAQATATDLGLSSSKIATFKTYVSRSAYSVEYKTKRIDLILRDLCFYSKNLYNFALYRLKDIYKTDQRLLSLSELDTLCKNSDNDSSCYCKLPAKVSQKVLIQLYDSYKSFFASINAKATAASAVSRLPAFKKKDGLNNLFFNNQAAKLQFLKGGWWCKLWLGPFAQKLMEQHGYIPSDRTLDLEPESSPSSFIDVNGNLWIPVKQATAWGKHNEAAPEAGDLKLKQVNIVPVTSGFSVNITYDRKTDSDRLNSLEQLLTLKGEKFNKKFNICSLDANVNGYGISVIEVDPSTRTYAVLDTCLLDLRDVKSENWYANKRTSELKQELARCHNEERVITGVYSDENDSQLIKAQAPKERSWGYSAKLGGIPTQSVHQLCFESKKTSHAIQKVWQDRNNYMDTKFNQMSAWLLRYVQKWECSNIVFGHNPGQKQNSNIGRVNNQNFVSIPFAKMIQITKLKALTAPYIYGALTLEGAVCSVEESYTSQRCALTGEALPVYGQPETFIGAAIVPSKGKRTKRGIWITGFSSQLKIHADINASLNIARKWLSLTLAVMQPEKITSKPKSTTAIAVVEDGVWGCSCSFEAILGKGLPFPKRVLV